MRCSACQQAFYCSRDHQKEAWSQHKGQCLASRLILPPPSAQKALIIGSGMFGCVAEGDDFHVNRLVQEYTKKGVAHIVIDNKKKILIDKLTSGEFNICVAFGIGSGGVDKGTKDPDVQTIICEWVKRGGRLVVHGERDLEVLFRLFDKNWAFEGDFYRRTEHCRNECPSIPRERWSTLPSSYNVKACMVSGVEADEMLYSPKEGATTHSLVPSFGGIPVNRDKCPVAVSSVGEGIFIFIGDVNSESQTMQVISMLTVA